MLLLANALNAVVFGFYRGRLQMERANGLQFVNFAVVPLLSVVVLATRGSIALMYSLMSVLMLVWTAAMAIPILRETHEQRSSWHVVSGELLRYGTARIPGELALNGLFTLAPVIASHFVSVANLAPLLLGLGILSVLGTSANPLNQVLLSKITMMLAEERMQQARRYIQHLLAGSIEVATFATVQAVLFADVAVRVWVGPKYVNQMVLIRILLAALPFYLLHTALRCVIDAASVTAYNTRNILWTFFTFVAVIAIAIGVLPSARLLDGIAGAFLVSLIVLAWLTVRTLKHLYDVGFAWRGSLPSLAFSFLVGIVGFGARAAQHFQTSALQFAGFQLLFGGLFLLFLNRHGSPWMGFLREAFLQRKTVASNAAESLVLKSA
jgi:O-antigen/teichoic acid export membrane protein